MIRLAVLGFSTSLTICNPLAGAWFVGRYGLVPWANLALFAAGLTGLVALALTNPNRED